MLEVAPRADLTELNLLVMSSLTVRGDPDSFEAAPQSRDPFGIPPAEFTLNRDLRRKTMEMAECQ